MILHLVYAALGTTTLNHSHQHDSLEALYSESGAFLDETSSLIDLCMHDLMYRSGPKDTVGLAIYGNGLEFCMELYNFCQNILSSNDLAFEVSVRGSQKEKQVSPLRLAKFFSESFFEDIRTYCDTQLCLREQHIIMLMNIFSREFPLWLAHLKTSFLMPAYTDQSFDNKEHTLAEDFNKWMLLTKEAFGLRTFKQSLSARKHKSKRRHHDSMELVESLLQKHQKLVVIRLDLGLNKRLTWKRAKQHPSTDLHAYVAKLLNNKKFNSIFDSLVGYIRKYEYLSEWGVYEHIILLFSEEYSPASYESKVNQISQYWEEVITAKQSKGFCIDCSLSIQPYRRSGTPYIDHTNIAALSVGIEYLAKAATLLDYSPRSSKQKIWVTSYKQVKNEG